MTTLHPQFAQHGSFAHLKTGRLPSRHNANLFRLAKYIDEAVVLPTIPPDCDLTIEVPSWPMYDNDRLGDCTCAAAGHMVQAWTAANENLFTPDPSVVDLFYWQTGTPPSTSGTAGGSTDTGRVETDVLDFWRKDGFGGGPPSRSAPITAYTYVDPKGALVTAGVYLFGGLYLGISLPLTAQTQTVWDVTDPTLQGNAAPGSWGGHAVPALAYSTNGSDGTTFKIVTWGGVLEMTEAFWNAYVDEAYAILSPDWFGATGKTPPGFDVATLTADLAAL